MAQNTEPKQSEAHVTGEIPWCCCRWCIEELLLQWVSGSSIDCTCERQWHPGSSVSDRCCDGSRHMMLPWSPRRG